MLSLVLGLALCVTSSVAYIPPWTPTCLQKAIIPSACVYGNLTVTLFSQKLFPKECNSQVEIKELKFPPVIHINSTNATDRFTVFMVDVGQEGRGPTLLWMVTNVSITSLPLVNNIPVFDRIEDYHSPSLTQYASHRTLVQILVFRHHNVLRVPFGELWVKMPKDFSLSLLLSNSWPNLRLCGPVAGTQFWVYDSTFTPSAPPVPPQVVHPPQQPVYVPVVPVIPAGQVVMPQAPGHAGPDKTPSTTFHKRSSASVSHQLQMWFVPLVVLTVMWL